MLLVLLLGGSIIRNYEIVNIIIAVITRFSIFAKKEGGKLSIIDRIFLLLDERKISSRAFAAGINISTGNVSDWKSGRSRPNAEAISKIADYFDVSVDYIFGRTDDPAPPNTSPESPATPRAQKVASLFDKAVEDDKKAVEYTLKKYEKPADVEKPVESERRLSIAARDGRGFTLVGQEAEEAEAALMKDLENLKNKGK